MIRYTLPSPGLVTISIVDMLGRRIFSHKEGLQLPGEHRATVNLSGHSSGVYFIVLDWRGSILVQKMIMTK